MLDINKIPNFKFSLSCECGNIIEIGGGIPLVTSEITNEEDVYNCKKITGLVDFDKFGIEVGDHKCEITCKLCGKSISIVGI